MLYNVYHMEFWNTYDVHIFHKIVYKVIEISVTYLKNAIFAPNEVGM